jgi:arginyl-tRNA synthetase
MLRYTRNSVIAFDFKDALSFEGETGPYLQYAVVRVRSIFRKAGTTAEAALSALESVDVARYLTGEGSEGIWEVWLRAGKTTLLLDQCIQTAEPAYLAKHAFQLAQDFSNFYRLHHILSEEDPAQEGAVAGDGGGDGAGAGAGAGVDGSGGAGGDVTAEAQR